MIKRYSTMEMTQIWSLKNKFNNYLRVELSVLRAYQQLGIIDQKNVDNIFKNAKIDLNLIAKYEKMSAHDVFAFIRAVSENLKEDKNWFHYGLTSNDIIDTAFALSIKEANKILEAKFLLFANALKAKALDYKKIPAIARTHGVHAEITSFGLRWLNYYDEFIRNWNYFKIAARGLERGKISGAVGNFANLPFKLQDLVCKDLKLNSTKISSQVISRDFHAKYIFACASIASTLEKIAVEIRGLQRTEIGEINEAFSSTQKGSSAMPHKKNPIASENITGISRIIRSYIAPSLEDNILWHERDISHSSVERIIFPDITNLLDYSLTRFSKVIENLNINEANINKNIHLTKNRIFSQKLLNILVEKGVARLEAYDIIQNLTLLSEKESLDFKILALREVKILKILKEKEILAVFELESFMKNIEKIYERVLEDET